MTLITMTTFLSLDGVMQAPGGPTEDPSDGFQHGGWLVPFADADMGAAISEIFDKASAFLLGRRTYDIFAGHWPRITDPNDLVATKLNTLPKYIVSRTLREPRWAGSSVLQRDLKTEVAALKARHTGEVQVHGSCGLAQALIQQDLVDEYRLLVFPVMLGSGRRLFGPGTGPAPMALIDSRRTSTGALINTYRRNGAFQVGSFQLS